MTAPNTTPPTSGSNGEIVVTNNTFAPVTERPAPNASVTAASEAARALIASQGTAAPATPANPGATPETPIREVPGQPRASDGTFGRPLPADPTAPGAAPDAAPATGQAPTTEQTPAAGGEAPVDGADAGERIVPIELPDGQALDLDVGDPQVAEIIRSSIETARDVDAIRTQAESQIADVVAIRESIAIDPVGFALAELRDSPAGQEHLVLSLLTQPEMFERLKPVLEGMLEDPRNLELARAKQVAARSTFAEQARHEVEQGRAVAQNVREVQDTCAAMARLITLPDGTPNTAVQQTAYNDMLRDLMAYADRANVLTIEPEYIPAILASRLTALGLNPVEAAQRAAEVRAGRAKGARQRHTASATPRAAALPAPPAATRQPPNGRTFVEAQQRRAAVAIPAGGAGSPGVGSDLVPPKNADGSPMNSQQTFAWHREQVAKGRAGIVRAG